MLTYLLILFVSVILEKDNLLTQLSMFQERPSDLNANPWSLDDKKQPSSLPLDLISVSKLDMQRLNDLRQECDQLALRKEQLQKDLVSCSDWHSLPPTWHHASLEKSNSFHLPPSLNSEFLSLDSAQGNLKRRSLVIAKSSHNKGAGGAQQQHNNSAISSIAKAYKVHFFSNGNLWHLLISLKRLNVT